VEAGLWGVGGGGGEERVEKEALQHAVAERRHVENTFCDYKADGEQQVGRRYKGRDLHHTCINVLQHTTIQCNTVQHTCNTHCNTSCNALQRTVTTKPPGNHTLSRGYEGRDLQHTHITHCNTLQHTATHCNTLQHTVCTTLQHDGMEGATFNTLASHTTTRCNKLNLHHTL